MARFLQFEALTMMAGDPAVTACGPVDFQKLTMVHDGDKWVIELEAVVEGK